jgi:hypothetical protein
MNESWRSGHGGEFFTLVEALRGFRAGRLAGDPSDRALARAAGVSPTTIGDWLQGRRFPQDIGKVLVMVRMVRAAAVRRGVAIAGSGPTGLLDEDRRRAAYQQEAQRRASVVSGAVERAQAVWALAGPRVRVDEADLRLLGVHATISAPGVSDEVPPQYVPRDVDAAEFGVRAKVAAAAQRGGFVLLVGGSCVGKTRAAAETVKALLPDWWLVHPADPAEVAALAQALEDRGDLDGLRARADTGNESAEMSLARLLAERGDLDGLLALAPTGNLVIAWRLPDLMTEQGRGEEAERLRRFGLNPDGSIAHA